MFMLLTSDTGRYERKILNLSYLQTETSLINVPIYKHAVTITFYFLFNFTLFVYKNPSRLLNKDNENYLKELAIYIELCPQTDTHMTSFLRGHHSRMQCLTLTFTQGMV